MREPEAAQTNGRQIERVNPLLISQASEAPASIAKSIDVPHTQPMPEDPEPSLASPAAATFVNELINVAADRGATRGESVTVAIGEFRNQSRAAPQEFHAAMQQFVSLLTGAAASTPLKIQEFPTLDTTLELRGTVYLLRVGSDDHWEIYPSLHLLRDERSIWQPDSPFRVPIEGRK